MKSVNKDICLCLNMLCLVCNIHLKWQIRWVALGLEDRPTSSHHTSDIPVLLSTGWWAYRVIDIARHTSNRIASGYSLQIGFGQGLVERVSVRSVFDVLSTKRRSQPPTLHWQRDVWHWIASVGHYYRAESLSWFTLHVRLYSSSHTASTIRAGSIGLRLSCSISCSSLKSSCCVCTHTTISITASLPSPTYSSAPYYSSSIHLHP